MLKKKISREYAKTQLAIYKIINSNEEYLKQILNADYIYRSGENEGENIKYNTIYDKAVSPRWCERLARTHKQK